MRKVESINFRFGGRSTSFCSSVKNISSVAQFRGLLQGSRGGGSKLRVSAHVCAVSALSAAQLLSVYRNLLQCLLSFKRLNFLVQPVGELSV